MAMRGHLRHAKRDRRVGSNAASGILLIGQMHDPVFFDQGGIDADFSRDNPDQVLTPDGEAGSHAAWRN